MADRGKQEEKDQKKVVRISVRSLVEFVMRGGDIDRRHTAAAEKEAMQAGSRIHRKIQKQMGADYQAEVTLRHEVAKDRFTILVEGRADGVIRTPAGVTIDEIKGIYRDLRFIEEPEKVHVAQAMCYGYIYSFDHNLPSAGIQVTYCSLETEEIRRFYFEKTYEELEDWFGGLIHDYVKWARYQYHHELRRDRSLKELEFPYPYRSGQKELAVSVYRSIARGRNLFIQAPTGVGKTLSTLYPGLKAIGEGHGEKLFYLTAKTITRKVAEEAFAVLRKNGMYFSTVTITAKEKLCFLEKPLCNPDDCPYAKGHFDRVNEAVFDILYREQAVTRERILEYAQEYQICPFEYCLDISSWVDGIICDYNYVFDPTVRLKRYFAEKNDGRYLFLVDEAHNLVPRAREMFSARIIKEEGMELKNMLKGKAVKVTRLLDRLNRQLLELKREPMDGRWNYQILKQISHLALLLISLSGEIENWLEEGAQNPSQSPLREAVLDYYFNLKKFLYVYERLDSRYRIYAGLRDDGSFMVRMFAIDPSENLKECLAQGISTIFFSATLLPIRYYKQLLSGNQDDYAVYAQSPFPRENRLLLIGSDISGRYSRRNGREYEKVVQYLLKMTEAKTGNYMAFFPSYRYLKQIEDLLQQKIQEEPPGFSLEWRAQTQSMREQDKEEFLQDFEKEREGSFLALCVLGGFFSEGIDLADERLIGAAVVGTGLPMVCAEQEILKDYFEEECQRGFDYAFLYPGMNKVLQAAGRVIRTVRDRGVILLLDERFLQKEYQELFPREWDRFGIVTRHTVFDWLNYFWKEKP